MISAKLNRKIARKNRGAMITVTNRKSPQKPKVRIKKELNDFLALHIGDATDAYLRGLVINKEK